MPRHLLLRAVVGATATAAARVPRLRQQEAGRDGGLAEQLGEQWEHPGLDLRAAAEREEAAALLRPPDALHVGDAGRVGPERGGLPRGLVAGRGTTSACA